MISFRGNLSGDACSTTPVAHKACVRPPVEWLARVLPTTAMAGLDMARWRVST